MNKTNTVSVISQLVFLHFWLLMGTTRVEFQKIKDDKNYRLFKLKIFLMYFNNLFKMSEKLALETCPAIPFHSVWKFSLLQQ